MDAKNSPDFVIRLNKYLFTCDGNSFQNNQNMVFGTLNYVIAGMRCRMYDVRCRLKTRCTVCERYTIDDSARYTICLQNGTMHGVQKKLVYFGGNYWTMLFSSQKKRHIAKKRCELIKVTVLIACLFYEPPKCDFV